MSEPRFVLNAADRESKLWRDLRTHLNKKLDGLRRQNDADKDATETARLRGRIAEIKSILDLDKDQPEVQ